MSMSKNNIVVFSILVTIIAALFYITMCKCYRYSKDEPKSVTFKTPEVDKMAIINPESTKSFLIDPEEMKKQTSLFSKNKTFSDYADIRNWLK